MSSVANGFSCFTDAPVPTRTNGAPILLWLCDGDGKADVKVSRLEETLVARPSTSDGVSTLLAAPLSAVEIMLVGMLGYCVGSRKPCNDNLIVGSTQLGGQS